MNEITWPRSQLARLGGAIAAYVAGPVELTPLAERCESHERELFEVTVRWPDAEPRGVVWVANWRVATIALRPSGSGAWEARVLEIGPTRPDTAPRPLDIVLRHLRVEWAFEGGMRFGSMMIDVPALQVRLGGLPVRLDRRRMEVLRVLASDPGRWLTTREIMQRAPSIRGDVRTVTASIASLSNRLFGEYGRWVQARQRRGQRFCPPWWPVWDDLTDGDWKIRIDRVQGHVRVGGEECQLDRLFQLLCVHVGEPGRAFTREELGESLGVATAEVVRRESELNAALGRRYVTWDAERGGYTTRRPSSEEEQ